MVIKDREKVKERFQEYLDILWDKYRLSKAYEKDKISRWVNSLNPDSDEKFYVANGASRCVIFDENRDYVVKFNLYRERSYIETEIDNYKEAVNEGYEKAFAPCDFIMKYRNCFNVEIMEFCGQFEECDALESDSDDVDPDEVVFDFILKYHFAAPQIDKVYKWCDDMCINDIHTGNVGYYNGEPVMIDYCGF